MLTNSASETLHVFGALLLIFATTVVVVEGLYRILGKRGPLDLDIVGVAFMLLTIVIGLVAFALSIS